MYEEKCGSTNKHYFVSLGISEFSKLTETDKQWNIAVKLLNFKDEESFKDEGSRQKHIMHKG